MQATPRNARIDVKDVCHVIANIVCCAVPRIATKARTSRSGCSMGSPIRKGKRWPFAKSGLGYRGTT